MGPFGVGQTLLHVKSTLKILEFWVRFPEKQTIAGAEVINKIFNLRKRELAKGGVEIDAVATEVTGNYMNYLKLSQRSPKIEEMELHLAFQISAVSGS